MCLLPVLPADLLPWQRNMMCRQTQDLHTTFDLPLPKTQYLDTGGMGEVSCYIGPLRGGLCPRNLAARDSSWFPDTTPLDPRGKGRILQTVTPSASTIASATAAGARKWCCWRENLDSEIKGCAERKRFSLTARFFVGTQKVGKEEKHIRRPWMKHGGLRRHLGGQGRHLCVVLMSGVTRLTDRTTRSTSEISDKQDQKKEPLSGRVPGIWIIRCR